MSKKGLFLVNLVFVVMTVIDMYPEWPHTRQIVTNLITLLAMNAIMLHKSKANSTK